MQGSARSNDEERGALLSRKDLLREAAFVDGEWLSGVENLPVINPATEEEVGVVPLLGRAHAVHAVEAASRALPLWRARTAQHRALVSFADVHRQVVKVRPHRGRSSHLP